MRHGNTHRKLGVTASHRKAMFANMAVALIENEQIKTTLAKAKDLRSIADQLITLGKKVVWLTVAVLTRNCAMKAPSRSCSPHYLNVTKAAQVATHAF